MKKLNVYILAMASLLTLSSCGGGGGGESSSSTPESSSTEPAVVHPVDIDVPENPHFDEPAVYFHYYRQDNTYADWDLWLWEKDADGTAYAFNYKDNWGVIAAYPLSTWNNPIANTLGFLVRKGGNSWAAKDLGGNDLYFDFNLFEKDANDVYHAYLISGQSDIYTDSEGHKKGAILTAAFTSTTKVTIQGNMVIKAFKIKEDDTVLKEGGMTGKDTITYEFEGTKPKFASTYTAEVTLMNDDVAVKEISKNVLYNDEEFCKDYNYDGDDLGAVYSHENTTFKVWSPASTEIKVRLYENGSPTSGESYQEFPMVKGEKGVFSYTYIGDIQGKYYTYIVTNSSFRAREIVDPYAKSAGLNGVRGMVVDFSKTNPEGWNEIEPHQTDRKNLVVYETHVADVTSSKTWLGTEANRKKFRGMYEEGTTYQGVTTGFDHIKEMGVNAVQLIPIFDQANDEADMTFNWGYNPLNYNVLEGGYSSNPNDGYVRIREFKELVKAYSLNGMNIIMDVVYNHVNGAQGSNFDVLMPGYFYRYNNNGSLSNGSGCGNETASDHYMFRKFMIDSAKFWAKEYKLGGFRFDLMGLHDLDTMEQLVAEVKTVNPGIVVYGEPWTGGTTPLSSNKQAIQDNGTRFVGYGAFNDKMRDDLIKGGLNSTTSRGWITNNAYVATTGGIVQGMKGITPAARDIYDPNKTLNYVTCHDNYTLFDRAIATKKFNADDNYEELQKMNVLANAVVMTSQGTSFMLAGEEFLRTKGGNHNSYNASYEVNELDYALKVKNASMVENYKKLIELKTTEPLLALEQAEIASMEKIETGESYIKATIEGTEHSYVILHKNGYKDTETVEIPEGYSVYWDTLSGTTKDFGATIELLKYETVILRK